MAKHSRGAFDSTPSFSSPLAYASTLPIEQADDMDLDSPMPVKERRKGEEEGEEGEKQEIPTQGLTRTISPLSSYRPLLPIRQYSPRMEAYSSNDEDAPVELLDTPTPSTSSTARRERSTSARARLLAWDKQDAVVQHLGRAGGGGQDTSTSREESVGTGAASLARRKSHAPTTLMGPPLIIPRKTSASTISADSGTSNASAESRNNSSSGRQEPDQSNRAAAASIAASGASDDEASISPPSSWKPESTTEARKAAISPPTDKITPIQRIRSNTQSSAHRRAKSLGGALLGETASPIGGPDGVDPDLVAAIRAGDSSIPGTSKGIELSLSRLSLGTEGKMGQSTTPSVSPSSRIASLPSTPSGSVRTPSFRKPSDQLSVIPDTRALANSYPTLQVPRREDESAPSSPKATRQSPDYVRSRVRSQTMAPSMAESPIIPGSGGALSSSFGPSSNTPTRANAPLGEAIRLQRMPSSIRMAGDFYNRGESSNRLHPSPAHSTASSNTSSGHGLGIGMATGADGRMAALPQTPSVTRSVSPMLMSELTRSSSRSSSGRGSPVIQRLPVPQSTTTADPSPLTVQIPAFREQEATLGPLSAMPALHYQPTQSSPTMHSSLTAGSSTSSSGPMSHSHSAFAPLLAMPSARQHRPTGRASVGAADAEVPDLDARYGERFFW